MQARSCACSAKSWVSKSKRHCLLKKETGAAKGNSGSGQRFSSRLVKGRGPDLVMKVGTASRPPFFFMRALASYSFQQDIRHRNKRFRCSLRLQSSIPESVRYRKTKTFHNDKAPRFCSKGLCSFFRFSYPSFTAKRCRCAFAPSATTDAA